MKLRLATLACALAATALSAQAGDNASASATLANFKIQLIDLAPDDGVAPQFIFYNHSSGGVVDLWRTWHGKYQGSVRSGYLYEDGLKIVQFDDDLAAANAALYFSGSLVQAGTDMGGVAIAEANGYFQLSAHTQMMVSWTAETDSARTVDNVSRASAEIFANLFGGAANQPPWFSFALSSANGDGAKSQLMSFQWSSGEQAATGHLKLRTEARIDASVVAVPEPGQWGMWLAGLAVAGVASRRYRA